MSERKANHRFDLVTGNIDELSCVGPHEHMIQHFYIKHLLGFSLVVALGVFIKTVNNKQ
jgi:hypothetical protein